MLVQAFGRIQPKSKLFQSHVSEGVEQSPIHRDINVKTTTYCIDSVGARRLNTGAILISTKSDVAFLYTPSLSALVKLPISCTRIASFINTPKS